MELLGLAIVTLGWLSLLWSIARAFGDEDGVQAATNEPRRP
jgi:hypothetical protein